MSNGLHISTWVMKASYGFTYTVPELLQETKILKPYPLCSLIDTKTINWKATFLTLSYLIVIINIDLITLADQLFAWAGLATTRPFEVLLHKFKQMKKIWALHKSGLYDFNLALESCRFRLNIWNQQVQDNHRKCVSEVRFWRPFSAQLQTRQERAKYIQVQKSALKIVDVIFCKSTN